jgi:hypothetical protein
MVLNISLFWISTVFFRTIGQVFERMFLNGNLSDIFPLIRLRLWDFGEKDHRVQAHHIMDIGYQNTTCCC